MSWKWISPRTVEAINRRQAGKGGDADTGQNGESSELAGVLVEVERMADLPDVTIHDLAAGYLAGLAGRKPFRSRNSETGFVVAGTFLLMNDFRIDASNDEVRSLIGQIDGGAVDAADIGRWFRKKAAPPDAAYLVPQQDQ
ncbi:death on curing protein [Faunimonas pinastri]|uniref:Death on curing protein n=1 Tax=Faunimonas pinastri TaxID=1855383 RepID=A0A1H9P1S8_9HYPH|nr:hypothetical protein [Faunimonas pinastri]SER42142.1 death on curing protein [Faunimonas pinastri]